MEIATQRKAKEARKLGIEIGCTAALPTGGDMKQALHKNILAQFFQLGPKNSKKAPMNDNFP